MVAFSVGLVSILVQIILLREFLGIFQGNELTIGIVLGNWLLITGLGGYVGRKFPTNLLPWFFLAIGLSSSVQFVIIRLLRGQIEGLGEIFLASAMLVAPVAFLDGSVFTLAAKIQGAGRAYFLETLGSVLAGIIYTVCQSFAVKTFYILLLASGYSMSFGLWLLNPLLTPLSGVVVVGLLLLRVDKLSLRFPGSIIDDIASPYGNIVVTKTDGQINIFENGVPVFSTTEIIVPEEIAHFAMAQRPLAKRVLLVGGGVAVPELLKYGARIDYLEQDPKLLDHTLKILGSSSRVNPVVDDARRFIKKSKVIYDVVIVAVPDPHSAQLNRFYTEEFFREVKKVLKDDGVLVLNLSGSETYLSPAQRKLHSSVFKALKKTFQNVVFIPGEWFFYIASDAEVTEEVWKGAKGARYVKSEYLLPRLARMPHISGWLDEPFLNTDFKPISYRFYLDTWLEKFQQHPFVPVIIAIIFIIAIVLLSVETPNKGVCAEIFSTGFFAMGAEIVILLIYQIMRGSIYTDIGILFASFMIGMAFGSFWGTGKTRKIYFVISDVLAVVLCGIILLKPDAMPFFVIMLAIAGFIAGVQFPVAASILDAGRLYAFNLAGACAGTLIVSTIFIPTFGFAKTCLLLSAVKIMGLVAVLVKVRIRLPAFWVVTLLVFLTIGFLAVNPKTSSAVYFISLLKPYKFLVIFMLGLSLIASVRFPYISKLVTTKLFHLSAFLVLSLAAFLPIFKCFFKIPYLFCHVCPRQCIFGFIRPYAVPAMLAANLGRRPWCHHFCPIGIFLDFQPKGATVSYDLHKAGLVVLAFVLISYFAAKFGVGGIGPLGDFYAFFFKNQFSTSWLVLAVTFAFLVSNAYVPRPFCEICPIGVVFRLSKRVVKL